VKIEFVGMLATTPLSQRDRSVRRKFEVMSRVTGPAQPVVLYREVVIRASTNTHYPSIP
jgi:hypothetical protein